MTNLNHELLATFVGTFIGEGLWIDSAGESKRYEVQLVIGQETTRLLVSFTHRFVEEGNTTQGEFVFVFLSPDIFETLLNGVVVGNGYRFDHYLHFNIRIGEVFVETSYTRNGNTIAVRGSSTRNAEGRFIAWSEALTER